MPELALKAIVLRRRDSGESDRRLTLLTRESGKIDVVAKGARKSASRLAGPSEPLSIANFFIASGRRNSFVTQAQPLPAFRGLRKDFDRISFGLALAELYAAVLPFDEAVPEIFDLLEKSLSALETSEKPLVASIWAQTALLRASGVLPQFDSCVVCQTRENTAEAQLSPRAGGLLCTAHAPQFLERFKVRREAVIGLERVALLSAPPSNLKFSDECFHALTPFWRHFAEAPLPANEALARHLHQERLA